MQNNYHGIRFRVDDVGRVATSLGGGIGGCNSSVFLTFKTNELMLDTGVWYHLTTVIKSTTDVVDICEL